MIKALIVEDEVNSQELLKELIAEYTEGVEVVGTARGVAEALKQIESHDPDLLLLDIEELQQAIGRVVEKQSEESKEVSKERLKALISNLRNSQQGFKRIVLPTSNGFTVVDPKDILRCESDRNYTFIFLTDGRKILVSRTIKEYEEMLEDFNFFRVHQSHLINLAYLKNYIRGRGGQVELTDGTVVDVSARKKADFMRRLQMD
jgi:two-component system LytT family response regulator